MSDDDRDSLARFPRFNLLGKDWLDASEAAFYCCVSEDHFRRNASSYGLHPRKFMGKQVYEKAELYRAIYQSQQWQRSPSTGVAVSPTAIGLMDLGLSPSPAVEEALRRLRRHSERTSRKKPKST